MAPLETERVALEKADGRVLAEDVAARLTQPPFDASAMDGYAVRAADVAALFRVTLQLAGRSLAGAGFRGRVGRAKPSASSPARPCRKAPISSSFRRMPKRSRDPSPCKEPAGGPHIRPRGQDFAEGEVLLDRGHEARPARADACRRHEPGELPVRRKPMVAILATGNEVVPPGLGA